MKTVFRRPKIVSLYAELATGYKNQATHVHTDLPVNPAMLEKYGDDHYKCGLEACFSVGELNGVLQFQSALIKKLYDQGIAEFSPYVEYKQGSLVFYNNNIWKALKDIEPSLTIVMPTVCNKLTEPTECGELKEPSLTNGWDMLVTSTEVDSVRTELLGVIHDLTGSREEINQLQDQLNKLQKTVDDLVQNNKQ